MAWVSWMLDGRSADAAVIVSEWLAKFSAGLSRGDVSGLFLDECHWRDLVALTGEIRSAGGAAVVHGFPAAFTRYGGRDLRLDPSTLPAQSAVRAGIAVVEAAIVFRTNAGACNGIVRLCDHNGRWVCWTILTALRSLDSAAADCEPAYAADVRAPNWHDEREASRSYANRDPAVLVVGGGHAGLTIAARLTVMGTDTLVVDREKRIGDNWRLRYHNLKLHNQIDVNHMPYMPFPRTWPRYIPKDKLANWLEIYVEAMEINFWTETTFVGAQRDEKLGVWRARLRFADGSVRVVQPRHIVMAASVSAVKKIPDEPSLSDFDGRVLHSSDFRAGDAWADRPVVVLGTGTSGHDIAQHLHASGARVTMVQRSPTMVVNVDPSAQLYDGLYLDLEDVADLDALDLLNASFPLSITKATHKEITDRVKILDRETLDGLERAGFELEFGEDGTGWPLKYRTRGGGYYFNIGCSDLIIDGKIDVIQRRDIDRYIGSGVRMKDGSERAADLIVSATGYETQGALVHRLFGEAIARDVGQIWGFREDNEMAAMWTRTGVPGLWFQAGSFSQCRIYSRYLAQQIVLDERK